MKILSKNKDYYDYIVWKYGIDNSVVLNRISKSNEYFTKANENELFALAICWTIYVWLLYNWKYYFWNELTLSIIEDAYRSKKSYKYRNHYSQYDFWDDRDRINLILSLDRKYIDLNNLYGMPIWLIKFKSWWHEQFDIIYEDYSYNNNTYKIWLDYCVVNLQWFWIDKIIEAEEMYVSIYNFLIREKNIINNQSDIEKVNSHWFDPKYWFRTRK